MPSPFPGMNPYLEQPSAWQDFHQAFITHIRESLSEQVRPGFFVKIEEFVFIHEPSDDERRKMLGRPDVAVFERTGGGGVAVAEPRKNSIAAQIAQVPDVEIEKHSYVEIRDRHSRGLVTLIEVLSPTVKQYGPDREQYTQKRNILMVSPVSIVEIDLLRGGPRFPLTGVPECNYRVMVSRPSMRPDVLAWPITLRDALPVIPIPLKGDVPDASLDLQALLHEVYDAAGYEDYLYSTPPEPPLSAEHAEW
ncbi:MAG: DUF4058 family protein, partial [Planctomycetaceae bacterium]|nr:DUF4058 family protein [Planctomycetaceae bacterium]